MKFLLIEKRINWSIIWFLFIIETNDYNVLKVSISLNNNKGIK